MRRVRRLTAIAALSLAAGLSACGADEDTSTTSNASGTAAAVSATGEAAPAPASAPGGGGPGGVDLGSVSTVDELNALIQSAYGDAGLDLHRGHQPVESVLIDTLGISHDEMHVRMDAGQNLSAIAEDLDVGTDTLVAALVASWSPAIDDLESDGTITAEQAEQYREALKEAFTFRVTWDGSAATPTFSGIAS